MTAQIRDVLLAFGGNRRLLFQGHRCRCVPQWKHWPRTTPLSQVASLATHIRSFLTIFKSPVVDLFIMPTYFCFSSISLPFTPLKDTRGLSVWCCLSSGQECYILLLNYGARPGHLGPGLPIPRPVQCRTGGHLRLAPLLAHQSAPRQGSSVSGSLSLRTLRLF